MKNMIFYFLATENGFKHDLRPFHLNSVSIAKNKKKGLIFKQILNPLVKRVPTSNFKFSQSTVKWQASPDLEVDSIKNT